MGMVQITGNDDKPNILDQIHLDLDNEKYYDENIFTYRDPMKDILFDHDFIESEITKYNLSFDGCSNCNQMMKHFSDEHS